jgi:hypothetical protein
MNPKADSQKKTAENNISVLIFCKNLYHRKEKETDP